MDSVVSLVSLLTASPTPLPHLFWCDLFTRHLVTLHCSSTPFLLLLPALVPQFPLSHLSTSVIHLPPQPSSLVSLVSVLTLVFFIFSPHLSSLVFLSSILPGSQSPWSHFSPQFPSLPCLSPPSPELPSLPQLSCSFPLSLVSLLTIDS